MVRGLKPTATIVPSLRDRGQRGRRRWLGYGEQHEHIVNRGLKPKSVRPPGFDRVA